MQDFILLFLNGGEAHTIAQLHSFLLGDSDFEGRGARDRSRSLRNSLTRAIRGLAKAGKIKQNASGEWIVPGAREERERSKREERALIAYHEAGHAVISLAKNVPVEIATIKAKRIYAGMVMHPVEPRALGLVYSHRRVKHGRGWGYKFNEHANLTDVDAFGNPVTSSPSRRDRHAHIVISMAGGMAEAEYLKDGSRWDDRPGTRGDERNITNDQRKLGLEARKPDEYEAECKALLVKYWPMVEAVANRLLKEETIGGGEIYSLCERIARNVVRRQHLKGRCRRYADGSAIEDGENA
jgi:hypothetical protein